MKLFTVSELNSSLYTALIKHQFEEAKKLMQKGGVISDLLYTQVTGHDDSTLFCFLFDQVPAKQQELVKLAIGQGAIECLKLAVEQKNTKLPIELSSLRIRKNNHEMSQYLNSIVEKNDTDPTVFVVH